MASGMSNFNIKKSFVWKYGLSKLHKKKDSEDADCGGDARTPNEDLGSPLEPDLELRPQWEPPLAGEDPEVPQKRRGAPLVPAVHAPAATRTMDPAVSQYIRVVAQMQGYDVAGCRGVIRDGVVPFPKPETETPIYETLSEFHRGDEDGATIAEDQQTLYENDDTDDEISAPLYENGNLDQPIYANGMLMDESDEGDENPIYENLGVGEAPPSPVPSLPPKPAGVSEPSYGHLEVEVRSDHGYDSYQSPTSGSSDASGDSPAKLSPNSESGSGSECGAAQRALASVDTVAPPRAGIPPPPPLPPPPPATSTMVRAKKALGQTVSLPPTGGHGGADRPKLDLPVTKQERPTSEIENKLSTSFVAQLHDMLQKKTSGIKPEPEHSKPSSSSGHVEKSTENRVERNVEKRRSKTGDTMAFQMARKAVAQALQKGRPQETLESSKPKLTQPLSVPSDKPDVTAPVERVAVVPGVIPPPPPMPAPAAPGAGKLSTSLIKLSAPKSLQQDLKKKLEAKKTGAHVEKVEPKKKKVAPKPPDRSFSLPGFGNARLDIAKAFEEFKRNEAIKKEEALMKKKKRKYVDKLDLKDYKKPSSNTGEVEEEMFALAAESADAVGSELEQRPPMKSFLSDDPPTPPVEKTTANDRQSIASLAATGEELPAIAVTAESSESSEESSDEPPALPARSGPISDLPLQPSAVQGPTDLRGETSFESVAEERAESPPPRPRPLTKKPQLMKRPVQRASVTPPTAAITLPSVSDTPPSVVTTPPSATATPPTAAVSAPPSIMMSKLPAPTATPPAEQKSAPPAVSRPEAGHSEVTVSGSQVIQICLDGSWGVAERDTDAKPEMAGSTEQCQVEVNTNEHGTSVVSTVELVSDEMQAVSDGSGLREENVSHFSVEEPNKIKLQLGKMETTSKNEIMPIEPHVSDTLVNKLNDDIMNDPGTDESEHMVTDEADRSRRDQANTNCVQEICVEKRTTSEPKPASNDTLIETKTFEAETMSDDPNTHELHAVEHSTDNSITTESIKIESSTADLSTDRSITPDTSPATRCTSAADSEGGSGDAAVASHPRQMPGHAWVQTDRGVAADCRTEPNAQTETVSDRADSSGDLQSSDEKTGVEEEESTGEESDEKTRKEEEEGLREEDARTELQEATEIGDALSGTNEVSQSQSVTTGESVEDVSIPLTKPTASVSESLKKEAELTRQNAAETVDSDLHCREAEDNSVRAEDQRVSTTGAEEAENNNARSSDEECSAEVEAPVETQTVTAAVQSIKLHVSAPETVCESDAAERGPDAREEALPKPADSTENTEREVLPETDDEVTVTQQEKEQEGSTQEKVKMPIFRASLVEVESSPSSLEESVSDYLDLNKAAPLAAAPAPALVPVTAPVMEFASVDDIEAQVAALRSKVLSVNSLSSGVAIPFPAKAQVLEPAPAPAPAPATALAPAPALDLAPDLAPNPAPSMALAPAPAPAPALDLAPDLAPNLAPAPAPALTPASAPALSLAPAPASVPASAEVSGHVTSGQLTTYTLALPATKVEQRFEDLERAEREEETGVPSGTSAEMTEEMAAELPQSTADDTAMSDDSLTMDEVDEDAENAPKSVESPSIIANKSQTKHFLESRLQRSLEDPATTITSATQVTPATPEGSPAGPAPAKMATHEPISPPPGFDDATDEADVGGGQVEGVEFEEFDMDWAPRRPVAPPVRSYMFGEQLGQKPAPAPARSPVSPSYRDLFTAEEPASSTASVASAASLEEPRQDSACGTSATSEPEEPEEAEETSSGAETMIAQEIRELRRREEELRRLREKSLPGVQEQGEEPLSGYGSEERESFTEEPPCPSRLLPGDRSASHQRSRSADSLSSGHSSSGLGSDAGDLLARRRVTVKPFEETEDDQRWSYPRSAETPIEREIRLAKEREDERRREQAMVASRHTMAAVFEEKPATRSPSVRATPSPVPPPAGLANDPREAALRLATGRVQEEIQEATRREIELRDEGKEITTSEETVDEKVTRLVDMTKHSVELTNDKKQRTEQARETTHPTPKPNLGPKPAIKPVHIVPRPSPEPGRAAQTSSPVQTPTPAAGLKSSDTAPRSVFRPAVAPGAGRGLMHKFISSRGRLRPVSVFSPAPSMSGARELSPPRVRRPPQQAAAATAVSTEQTAERRGPAQAPGRRVLTAEAKIQLELQAMREREEELRRHRSRMMAKSQPDLLAALDDLTPSQEREDEDSAPGPLSRAMSNPNLLDDGPAETPVASANRRRRSTLIDQWESRIQGAEI